jgi:hypothetical protein
LIPTDQVQPETLLRRILKMKKMKWTQIALTASLLIMVSAVASQATVLRAFVSSTGSDGNLGVNCVQATPCKTFNVAIGAVTPGGELIALDTAGYGPITTIDKAITIATVPGAIAFVVAATGTSAFTINAGATDQVTLSNIRFNGAGAANTTGVTHNSGKLVVNNCTFTQLTLGLSVVNAKVNLNNCNILANTTGVKASGPGADDQNCPPCGGTTNVRVDGGTLENNTTAIVSLDPDFRPSSSDNRKQFLFHSIGGSFTTEVSGNTTFQSASGLGCTGGCSTIVIIYQGSQNPH